MARSTLSPLQARWMFTFIGALLLLQFWGSVAMDLITGENIEHPKGRPFVEGHRDASPTVYWSHIYKKLAIGACTGGVLIVFGQVYWLAYRGRVPEPEVDPKSLRRLKIALAFIGALIVAAYVLAFWLARGF